MSSSRFRQLLFIPLLLAGTAALFLLTKNRADPERLDLPESVTAVRTIEVPSLTVIPTFTGNGNVEPEQVWHGVAQVADAPGVLLPAAFVDGDHHLKPRVPLGDEIFGALDQLVAQRQEGVAPPQRLERHRLPEAVHVEGVLARQERSDELGIGEVAPGYREVRRVVRVESPAPESTVRELIEIAERSSPYLAVFGEAQTMRRELCLNGAEV